MTLYKRTSSPFWWYEFTLNGQRYQGSTQEQSKPKAREIERQCRAQILQQVRDGKLPRMTLREAVDRFVTRLERAGSLPDTLATNVNRLAAIARHFGPNTHLDEITTAHISSWVYNVLAKRVITTKKDPVGLKGVRRKKLAKREGARHLKASTINRSLTDLRTLLNMARNEWGVDAGSARIKLLKVDNTRVRYLSREQEAALLDACEPHVRAIVTFLMDTGLRKANAVKLTWDKVVFEGDDVRVFIAGREVKNRDAVGKLMPARTATLLRKLRDERPKTQKRVFLFHGRPFENFRAGFDAACVRAGIDDFTIHDLRHHYASKLLRVPGTSLKTVQEELGHRDIKSTMRYAHLFRGDREQAVRRLNDV